MSASQQNNNSLLASASKRTKIMLIVFGLATIGALAMLILMIVYQASETEPLYLQARTAGAVHNLVQILALPGLIFCLIVAAYSGNELLKRYRRYSNPKEFK